MGGVSKLLLHSTETRSWPGYPTFAPQFTYNPWTHAWRQHMPLPRSASTLADPSWTEVRENRDRVCQVEIVGYCDPKRWAAYGHNVEKMDLRAIADLGQFADWLHDEWGLPIRSEVEWVHYPASYGINADQRLSSSGFDAYTGILGHQHASGNSHGDPGKINISGILAAAKAGERPLGKIIIDGKEHDDIASVSAAGINAARDDGNFSRHIYYVQLWLDKLPDKTDPALPGRHGYWDARTQKAFNAFRRSVGFTGTDAEGAVGLTSLTKLRNKVGATKPIRA